MKNKTLLFSFCLTLSTVLFSYVGSNIFPFLNLHYSNFLKSQVIAMYTTPILFTLFFGIFFFKASNKNYHKFTYKALCTLFCSYLTLFIYAIIPITKSSFILIQIPSLLTILSATLLPFILWSYLNQVYTFKKAIKDYFLIICSYLTFSTIVNLIGSNLRNINTLYGFSILGFTFLGVAIYTLTKPTPISDEPTTEKITEKKPSYTFWFKLSTLLVIPVIVTKFIMLIFKYNAKVNYSTPGEYSLFLGNFTKAYGLFNLPFTLFCIFITYYLLKTRSPKQIIYYLCSTIFCISIISIAFMLGKNTLNIYPVIAMQTSLLNIKFFAFFPLIQLVFLKIDKSYRYKAKILTEVIFLKPLLIVGSLIPQILIVILGGFTPQMQVSIYIISISLIIALFFLWKDRKIFPHAA